MRTSTNTNTDSQASRTAAPWPCSCSWPAEVCCVPECPQIVSHSSITCCAPSPPCAPSLSCPLICPFLDSGLTPPRTPNPPRPCPDPRPHPPAVLQSHLVSISRARRRAGRRKDLWDYKFSVVGLNSKAIKYKAIPEVSGGDCVCDVCLPACLPVLCICCVSETIMRPALGLCLSF